MSETTPDQHNDVLATATHVCLAFQDRVKADSSDLTVVYDSDLSMESILRSVMAQHAYKDIKKVKFPIFAYNRSVMRQQTAGMGIRTQNSDAIIRVGDEVLKYTGAITEFDITFMFVSNSVKRAEQFEVLYHTDEGPFFNKTIQVEMPELGIFNYFISANPELNEFTISKDEVQYKAIAGQVTVRGPFFVFKGKSAVIKQIQAQIIASYKFLNKDEILSAFEINGE